MQPTEAESGAQALSILHMAAQKQEVFDIAILDLMMPEMDGFELARRIKTDALISKTHLVLLPSYGKRGDRQIAEDSGIAAYLQKPVRQSQLYTCLTKVISEASGRNDSPNYQPARLITQHSPGSAIQVNGNSKTAVKKARILVAEDNVVNQKVALNQLKNLGYAADVVSNGREAVDAIEKFSYDLVLMDCQMPEMDGYQATAEIRRLQGDLKRTPIIAMTAHALEGECAKCLTAGMDDYLSKPVKMEILGQMLEQWTVSVNNQADAISENPNTLFQKDDRQVVDLSILSGFRDWQQPDQPDLVTELIDLFIKDVTQRLLFVQKAVIDGDTSTIKKEAHTVRGAAGNIGAQYMTELCAELEQKANQIKEAETLVSLLQNEFKQVIEDLNSIRKSGNE
jgi:CheY-like chemotaxis protein